jgi:hypothetical protein
MQSFRQFLMQVDQHLDGRDVALLPSILLIVGSEFALSPLQLTVHLGLCPEPLPVPALSQCPPIISCGEEPSPGVGNGDGCSFIVANRQEKNGTDGASNPLRDH